MSTGKLSAPKSTWQSLTSRQKNALLIIIIAALVLRLVMAFVSDSFNHPDENYQIMEQAHRLVFGYGFIPWEYRFAARSWMVPGIMSLFLFSFKWLGIDRPEIYVPAVHAIMSIISLIFVLVAFNIATRLKSPRAGLWAAFITAVWYEMIYFAVRPLSEVWGALFFIVGLALVVKAGRVPGPALRDEKPDRKLPLTSTSGIFWGTLLICLSAAIRIDLIPLAAVAVLLYAPWRNKTLLLTTALAFIVFVVFTGLFETITLGKSFESYLHYYLADKTFFMQNSFGDTFGYDYLLFPGFASLFLFWAVWLAGLVRWKQSGKIVVLCLVVVLSHFLVPVKAHEIDYRHVFIVIPLTLIVGGIIISRMQGFVKDENIRKYFVPVMVVLIIIISTAGAFIKLPLENNIYTGKPVDVYSHSIFYNNPRLKAYLYLSGQGDVAGVLDDAGLWFRSGGYYYLHKNVPLYFSSKPPRDPAYFSHVVSREGSYVPEEFEPIKAFDDIIVYRRKDTSFIYKTDPNFTYDIFQDGIDNNPALLDNLR